jgi:GAF domain-containing protein
MKPLIHTSSVVWQDGRWVLACAVLASVVFALDVFVPVATAGGVPYIVVVMVCLWSPRRRSPLAAAAACSLLTVVGYFITPAVGDPSQAVVDRLLALLAIWATALLVLRRKEDLREHERRLREQMAVLVELAQNKALGLGELDEALCEITEAAARVLQTERVGVWLLTGDSTRLRCIELYERTPNRHSRGMELEAEKYPNYFSAIEKERVIPADQADVDLRTCEFRESYLGPLGIASMLDAGIRLRGRMIGVVCHEHVGPARCWTVEEQNFAGSIADFVGLAIEASERRRAEQELRKHRDRLEELVGVRTQELTHVNQQLTAEIAERNLAQQRLAHQAEELARSNAEPERFA